MPLKKIGITMRAVCEKSHGEIRDALAHDWAILLEPMGLLPVPVPGALSRPVDFARACGLDGLILSGGGNVSSFEGETKPLDENVEALRDRTERKLLDWAMDKAIPVLGVCRGMHALNVYFGGRLIRDLSARAESKFSHVGVPHKVSFDSFAINGLPESGTVNSWHNSGIDNASLSNLLTSFALSDDGVVEAFIHRTLPVIGLEWHPERDASCAEADRVVFEKLFDIGG